MTAVAARTGAGVSPVQITNVMPWPVPAGAGSRRMTVTPAIAAQMLVRNNRNREMVVNHVESIESDLRAGRWVYNGDSIRFDDIGNLLDGQHRLTAVVNAGISIDTLVIWGLPASVMPTVDTGRTRRGRDHLSLAGEEHPVGLAAVLRLVARWNGLDLWARTKLTNSALVAILDTHPTVRESVALAYSPDLDAVGSRSVMGFAHWLFSMKDREAATEFIRSIGRGADLSESDPRFILRRTCRNTTGGRTTDTYQRHLAAYYVKVWNAWRKGVAMQVLKFQPDETFPIPV